MEDALNRVLHDTSEIDSELLDDKTQVLGVLATDKSGLCLLSQGQIDKNLAHLVTGLAKIGSGLEPDNQEETPVVVLESNSKKLLIKDEEDVIITISKKK